MVTAVLSAPVVVRARIAGRVVAALAVALLVPCVPVMADEPGPDTSTDSLPALAASSIRRATVGLPAPSSPDRPLRLGPRRPLLRQPVEPSARITIGGGTAVAARQTTATIGRSRTMAPRKAGALWGLAIGATAGGIAGAIHCRTDCGGGPERGALVMGGVGAGSGALAGYLIGWLFDR